MANRTFTDFNYSLHKRLINLYMQVNIGASGAPTLQKWDPVARSFSAAPSTGWKGFKSIVRNSAGLYTITLQDAYNQFLRGDVAFGVPSAAAPAGPNLSWVTPQANINSATTPTLQVQFSSAGVATDPANGEVLYFEIVLSDSTAI